MIVIQRITSPYVSIKLAVPKPMTDAKSDSVSSFDISKIHIPDDNDVTELELWSARNLLNGNVARATATKFLVGKEKLELHGNLMCMAARSEVIKTLAESLEDFDSTSTLQLMDNVAVMEDIEPFMSVWLHMNSMPAGKYFMGFEQNNPITDSIVEEKGPGLYIIKPHPLITKSLNIWKWIDHFWVDPRDFAFSGYLNGLFIDLAKYAKVFEGVRNKGHNVTIPECYLEILRDMNTKLAIIAASGRYMPGYGSLFLNMRCLIEFLTNNSKKFTHITRAGFFGYTTKSMIEEEKAQKKKEEDEKKELEEAIRLNKEMWESLGPAPYPKFHQYIWPRFYLGVDWKTNTIMWDNDKIFSSAQRTDRVPEGGYEPGKEVPNLPYSVTVYERLLANLPSSVLGDNKIDICRTM